MRKLANFTFLTILICGLADPAAKAANLFTSGAPGEDINGWDICGCTPTPSAPVANSFQVAAGGYAYGISFAAWVTPGDTLTSVDWSIVSDPTGAGTTYASGTADPIQTFLALNIYGFNIDDETFSIPTLPLNAGTTYWLVLQNGLLQSQTATNADLIFWDENDNPNSINGLQAYVGGIGYLSNTTDPTDCPVGISCTETFSVNTPEPGSLGLLSFGILGMAAVLRRRVAAK